MASCWRACREQPRADVEDLVQDAFVIAMQRLGTLRAPEAFGGWIATIARNLATDHLRAAPRTSELIEDARGDTGPASPGARVARAHGNPDQTEALLVLTAIRALPEAYRETLTLRLVEGMTGPEIAARTGLTPASVRVNLHRGMKQLRERLKVSHE